MTERQAHYLDTPERQCYGKKRYKTRSEARLGARRSATRRGRSNRPLKPYRCPHCGGIHLGGWGKRKVDSSDETSTTDQ